MTYLFKKKKNTKCVTFSINIIIISSFTYIFYLFLSAISLIKMIGMEQTIKNKN